MSRVETVEVDRNGTKVIVDKDKFNPEKDKLWGEKEEQPKRKPGRPSKRQSSEDE